MHHKVAALPVVDPFRTARQDFERLYGLRSDDAMGLRVVESEAEIHVSLDLPGLSEDDVQVTVDDGHLLIKGERKKSVPESAQMLFSNQSFGEFQRTLQFHDSLDPESVQAVMENGVLTITIARRPELQPRRINVRAAKRPVNS
ncbi:MAG: Hsp20/alpha crystallin family protein [Planctomycetaceae bacterium]